MMLIDAMMKLVQRSIIQDMNAGGPGSGCRGANCGRPISGKTYQWMVSKLRESGLRIRRGISPWDVVRTFDAWKRGEKTRQLGKKIQDKITKRAKGRIQKAIQKGRLPKIGKGIDKIDVKPVWKGRVKKEFTSSQGHKITEIKTPQQYEKNKGTWVLKPSSYKGQFLVDIAEHKTYNDPKERNHFFIHMASPENGVSVEVHRNLGKLNVNVIERRLGAYGAIVSHREVSFKNVGRAMGFMNKRYGITFKLNR